MAVENISEHAERAASLESMAEKVANSAARLPQIEDGTPEQVRAFRADRGNPFAPEGCDLAAIADLDIPIGRGSVRARCYTPHTEALGDAPCLVFFHGGGYVLSTVEEYDTVTQQLAFHSGCKVISVDYELAPANKIKSIHHDGFDAYCWIREHAADLGIDAQRIAVGGDSAGGNLTVAITLLCKRENYPMPAFQLLIYPSVDPAMSFPSVDEFATGYFLTKNGMSWFRDHYLESPDQANDSELNFLQQDLAGLPPAWLMTAGFDPLRDEGKAYAEALERFSVPVTHICYTDMIHAFVSFAGGIKAGAAALQRMGSVLRNALAP